MDNVNKFDKFIKVFIIFMIGSVIGYVVEMIVALVQNGYIESRQGLLYGPFTPVYGIGIIVYYIFFNKIKTRDKKIVFLLSMLIGGITEYLCSFIQEKVFGTISWDYSEWLFNINGRTTLIHCTYWGIAGLLYVSYIEPLIPKIENAIRNNHVRVITSCLVICMVLNITISTMAALRQKERIEDVPASGTLYMFLDKNYPNEYIDRVFANKKQV